MSALLLVPTDFSSCARSAMRIAAKLAPSLGAKLLLFHVAEIPPGLLETSEIRPMPDQEPMQVGHFVRDASLAELERYARELRALGVDVEARVDIGDPVESILSVAGELDPVMIVMGTHGRTGIARLLMGSIAEKVMRRADRPVLTVPVKAPSGADAAREGVAS